MRLSMCKWSVLIPSTNVPWCCCVSVVIGVACPASTGEGVHTRERRGQDDARCRSFTRRGPAWGAHVHQTPAPSVALPRIYVPPGCFEFTTYAQTVITGTLGTVGAQHMAARSNATVPRGRIVAVDISAQRSIRSMRAAHDRRERERTESLI